MQTTDIATKKADCLVHEIYRVTRKFPKEELYGLISQLRRAALSIVLNLIEGYARNSKKEYRRFAKIAYGSLKETKYLVKFSFEEKYLSKEEFKRLTAECGEIGKLVWLKFKD